jgi:hypothetical protein
MLGFMCETELEGTGEERCWKKDGGWRRARIICKQSLVGSSVIGCRECGHRCSHFAVHCSVAQLVNGPSSRRAGGLNLEKYIFVALPQFKIRRYI